MNASVSRIFQPIGGIKATLRSWTLQRSPRERILIAIALSGVGLWLLWSVLLTPLDEWREDAQREAGAWERRLVWLETQPRTQTKSELRPRVLTSSIGGCGLQLLRVNQESEAILVTLQEQSFECVLDWLIRVETDHGIQVEQLRLQAGQRSGSVSGTLRFAED